MFGHFAHFGHFGHFGDFAVFCHLVFRLGYLFIPLHSVHPNEIKPSGYKIHEYYICKYECL